MCKKWQLRSWFKKKQKLLSVKTYKWGLRQESDSSSAINEDSRSHRGICRSSHNPAADKLIRHPKASAIKVNPVIVIAGIHRMSAHTGKNISVCSCVQRELQYVWTEAFFASLFAEHGSSPRKAKYPSKQLRVSSNTKCCSHGGTYVSPSSVLHSL